MDSRQLLPDEFKGMVEVIEDAAHEDIGGLKYKYVCRDCKAGAYQNHWGGQ